MNEPTKSAMLANTKKQINIPENWFLGELSDCVMRIGDGGTPSTNNSEFYGGRIPWAVVHDIKKYIYQTKNTLSQLGLEKSSAKLWPKDAIIISTGATIGEVGIAKVDLATKQGIAGIETNERVVSEFLYYSLIYKKNDILSLAQGSTIKEVRTPTLVTIPILYPPLPEQQKIANILSSVDEVIEKIRAQIDKLKDLKTGMMQDLLTKGIGHTEFKGSPVGRIPQSWSPLTLGEVFDLKNGVNKDKTAFGHGVPIISYKNVYNGGGIFDSDISGLVEMSDLEISRFRVEYGDVFFTRTSETPEEIGFANVYLGNGKNIVFNGFVIRGRQKKEIFDPHFMQYLFQSDYVRKQMMDNSKFTTRAGISGEALGKIVVASPNISEQVKLAQILGSIDSRRDCLINKLSAAITLKKALMQDLLTGKVRVKLDKESTINVH